MELQIVIIAKYFPVHFLWNLFLLSSWHFSLYSSYFFRIDRPWGRNCGVGFFSGVIRINFWERMCRFILNGMVICFVSWSVFSSHICAIKSAMPFPFNVHSTTSLPILSVNSYTLVVDFLDCCSLLRPYLFAVPATSMCRQIKSRFLSYVIVAS